MWGNVMEKSAHYILIKSNTCFNNSYYIIKNVVSELEGLS